MAGLRDKVIHGYFAINYEIVWDVIQHKLPELNRRSDRCVMRLNRKNSRAGSLAVHISPQTGLISNKIPM